MKCDVGVHRGGKCGGKIRTRFGVLHGRRVRGHFAGGSQHILRILDGPPRICGWYWTLWLTFFDLVACLPDYYFPMPIWNCSGAFAGSITTPRTCSRTTTTSRSTGPSTLGWDGATTLRAPSPSTVQSNRSLDSFNANFSMPTAIG